MFCLRSITDSINKILDKILENVSMDKTVSSMMQSSWMSADDKRCIEKQDDRKACLQKIVINEKDQALLQLVKLLPIGKFTYANIDRLTQLHEKPTFYKVTVVLRLKIFVKC